MEAKVNYTVVGLAVVILGAALIATALWLSVGFDQKSYKTYAVFMNEAASGLSEEAPVRFSGVKVGYVKQISLNHNNPQQVIILLSIEDGTPVTTNTSATLISQGITGVSYIGLSAKGPNLTPLKAPKGYPYPIIPAKPSLFNQLDKAIQEVSENIGSVSKEIKRVFDEENAMYLKKTMANLSQFTETLAKNTENINKALIYTNRLTKNIATASDSFPQLVQHFDKMTEAMATAGNKVSSTMENGSIAIEKLSQQTVPAANSLMRKLNDIATNIEKVSVMMRQNPSVIIRGTSPVQPGPGEH